MGVSIPVITRKNRKFCALVSLFFYIFDQFNRIFKIPFTLVMTDDKLCFRFLSNQNPFCSYLFTVILWIQIFGFFFTNVHSSSIWTCERFKSRNRCSATSSQCSPPFFSHADTVYLSTPAALPVPLTLPFSASIANTCNTFSFGVCNLKKIVPLVSLKLFLQVLHTSNVVLFLP